MTEFALKTESSTAPNYEEQFPLSRRAEMIGNASKDRRGRSVIYYRYMPQKMLDKLLEDGMTDSVGHFDQPDTPISENHVKDVLMDWLKNYEIEYKLDVILEEVHKKNPYLANELAFLVTQNLLTPRMLHPLLDENLDRKTLMNAHTGSMNQVLSPYLSMSVGGVITSHLPRNYVYVELVIPDEYVEPQVAGFEGEKEVLTKQLRKEWITRVYTSTKQLWDEIITNPETPIGQYYERGRSSGDHPFDAIEKWRWEERTEDYLPVSLTRSL